MTHLRRALGPLVAVWLACHLGQIVAVPAILWATGGAAQVECTCAHGDHTVCPMHHARTPGSSLCVMQGTGGAAAVAVTAFALIGMPAGAPRLVEPASHALASIPTVSPALARASTPDPPPPRA